jgi:glycosyltransferase involved in cell wall biosynthesis
MERARNIILVDRGIRQTLKHVPHEIIVVDDASPDGTYSLASKLADRAICKKREGKSIALLMGIREAMYPLIVTIDADLENDPANIPKPLEKLAGGYDLVVASRPQLPRWSERLFATTIGRRLGIKDALSNFRAMRAEKVKGLRLDHGETFGAEFLIKAHAWPAPWPNPSPAHTQAWQTPNRRRDQSEPAHTQGFPHLPWRC